ncbi:hypothetical protein F4V91_08705 [Neorhizobium galegae]|uniref:DUF2570 domain-containing protein n=1 Tax=Neorhizobium galegae TaxID=399 RepID=A0A6A1TQQ8_NEOGA|nr:hypothetical protein [Neorhizobium galegae]KAB1086500.1 hypothetical protein F4V91_08705 [Neorhizobium galegae]
MIAFLLSPVGRWLAGAVAALALLVGAYTYVDHKGYQRAAAHYTAKIAATAAALAEADANEQRRQTIANNAAKQREAAAIAALEAQEADNIELRRRLASEAQQDPDADRPSLGAGSVQRLNKIR